MASSPTLTTNAVRFFRVLFFEAVKKVTLCFSEKGGFRLEVQPFGFSREANARWLELYRQAETAGA